MSQQKPALRWMYRVQKLIFVLLLANTFVLALVIATPYLESSLDWRSPFAREPARVLESALPVQQDSGLLFGNLRIETADGLSLGAAELYINGLLVGNFGTGGILTRVYEGDSLVIEASAYKRPLNFTLTTVSTNIDVSELPSRITTNGNAVELPLITFK